MLNRIEELKELGRCSTKLGSLASKDNANKIIKRKHRDFCMWEQQIKQEHRKEKKMRERDKGAMDECLGKTEEIKVIGTNQNATENCNNEDEDIDMTAAAGEEMSRIFGGQIS